MTRGTLLGTAVLLVAAATGPARAFAPHRTAFEAAPYRWDPVPLRCGVEPTAVQAFAPYVPVDAERVLGGPAEVAGERACAFRIAAGSLVRVLHEPTDRLRFARLVAPRGPAGQVPTLRVDEPGIPADRGVTYLDQPLGRGDVWILRAEGPATVRVERLVARSGRLAWEDARSAGLQWIETGGERPPLPPCERCPALASRLEAERELAERLVTAADEPAMARAVLAWRRASFLLALETVLATVEPYASTREVVWEDAEGVSVSWPRTELAPPTEPRERPYRQVRSRAGKWHARLSGPGALHVDVRAELPPRAQGPGPVWASVARDGVEIAAASYQPGTIRRKVERAEAFGRWEAVRSTEGGEQVSERASLVVPLAPGEHAYTLRLAGGPFVVRTLDARRRPRFDEAVRGEPTAIEWLRTARDTTAQLEDPSRRAVLDVLLDALDPPRDPQRSSAADPLLPGSFDALDPLVALAVLDAHAAVHSLRDEGAQQRRLALVRALFEDCESEAGPLAWAQRMRWARRFRDLGVLGVAAAWVEPRGGFPPGTALGLAATLLDEPPASVGRRSRRLAAADLARRAQLGEPHAASTHRRLHQEETRWTVLRPDEAVSPTDPPGRWLDVPDLEEESDAGADRPWRTGDLWRLAAGTEGGLVAPTSAFDPERPAILRVLLRTRDDAPGPVHLDVDDARFAVVASAALEPLELAIAPGEHRLRVEGPTSSEVWVSLPPAPGNRPAARARVRSLWRVPQRGQVGHRFVVPDPHLGGNVRLELRARQGAEHAGRPVTVRVFTDVGTPRTMHWISAPRPRHAAWGLDGAAALGAATRVTFALPPQAERVWLESDEDVGLVAQFAVRRPDPSDPAAARRGSAEVRVEPPLFDAGRDGDEAPDGRERERIALVAHASDALVRERGELRALVTRAHALIDLGYPDLARADLDQLVARADLLDRPGARHAAEELAERLELWSQPTHALSRAPAGMLDAPAPLSAALVAFPVGTQVPAHAAAIVRALRVDGPDAARRALESAGPQDVLPPTSVLALDALIARAERRSLAAFDALVQARSAVRGDSVRDRWVAWAFGRSALEMDPGASGASSVAYGLAARLDETLEIPVVRRARLAASRSSTWKTVRDVARSAGRDQVTAARRPGAGRLTRVREALVAPPWARDEGVALRPGRGTVVRMNEEGADRLEVDLLCRSTRVDRDRRPCTIVWRLDGGDPSTVLLALDTTGIVPIVLAPGRHRVEVRLASENRRHIAGVRFRVVRPDGSTRPLAAQSRITHFAAGADEPVRFWVRGPTSIRVEARSFLAEPLSGVEIVAESEDGTAGPRRTLAMEAHADPTGATMGDGAIPVTAARVATLVLPDPVAYHLSVRPRSGTALVRLAYRAPTSGSGKPERRPPRPHPAPDRMAWPTLPDPFGAPPPATGLRTMAPWGTLSLGIAYRGEDLSDADASPATFRDRAEFALAWRRRIEAGPYLRAVGLLRKQADADPALGFSASSYWSRLGSSATRLLARGDVFAQSVDGSTEASVLGMLRLDHAVALTRDVEMLGRFGFRVLEYTLDGADRDEVDPRVFLAYGADHDRALVGELDLRWYPFQDQRLSTKLRLVQNADLVSTDHVDLEFAWNGLIALGKPFFAGAADPQFRLRYRPSLRFDDEHRDEAFVRHDLGVALRLSLWTGPEGRFRVELRDDLVVGPEIESRNAFTLALRYDWTSGRGLRDILPTEELFRDQTTDRQWADER